MAGAGKDGDDDTGRGDAGNGHGHGGRVQPTAARRTFGHRELELARPAARGLVLPLFHANQCDTPGCTCGRRTV